MSGETSDLGALAKRLADLLGDVRACLLMSHEDRSVGVHPGGEEPSARSAWDQIRALGDLGRGYLVVGEELWVVAQDDSLGVLVKADRSRDPQALMAQLEPALRRVEEERAEQETVEAEAAMAAPMASNGDGAWAEGELDTVALAREFAQLMDDGHPAGENAPR